MRAGGGGDRKDHAGLRYGRLTVIKRLPSRQIENKHGNTINRILWLCVCDCGNQIELSGNALTSKLIRSCGCSGKSKETIPIEDFVRIRDFEKYRARAIKKGIEFELTLDQFVLLCGLNCHYCGAPPSLESKASENSKWVRGGIDRKNNLIGYTTANSLPCCDLCNDMKGTLDYGDFINAAHRIGRRT